MVITTLFCACNDDKDVTFSSTVSNHHYSLVTPLLVICLLLVLCFCQMDLASLKCITIPYFFQLICCLYVQMF
jgi:TRAP-type C4-dicarboxylate transport system permease large subunit